MESQPRLTLLVCGLLATLAGCDEEPAHSPGSAPSALASVEANALQASSTFRFRVHDYNWEIGGSTVYDVEAPNRFRYVFPQARMVDDVMHTDWKRIEVELSPARVTEFRALLERVDFTQLRDRYVDESIEDGAITRFYLLLDDGEQQVYCSNEYPDAARRALDWLRTEASRLDRSASVADATMQGQEWIRSPTPAAPRSE